MGIDSLKLLIGMLVASLGLLHACASDQDVPEARYTPGPTRTVTIDSILRLPSDYAVDVEVRWTRFGASPARDLEAVFAEWPGGDTSAPYRLAVWNSNGYTATYDGEIVRMRRREVLPATSGQDSIDALRKGFRIEHSPYGIAQARDWTYVGSTDGDVHTFSRTVDARIGGSFGEDRLFVEVSGDSGLPLVVRSVHEVLGAKGLTITKRFSGWRRAGEAGVEF